MKNVKSKKIISNKIANKTVNANVTKKEESNSCCSCFGHQMSGKFLFGLIVVLVGFGLLLQNIFYWFSFNYVWPLVIILFGVYLIKKSKQENN